MATRVTDGARRERHEKRNLKKKRDCSQSTTEFVFAEPSTEIDNNQRTNSYHIAQLVSETSLSSDCEMKAEAASGIPTKISTNIDSQSHNSRKRKMSEFSCNPDMQKHELFLLILLTSALLYLKGRSDC